MVVYQLGLFALIGLFIMLHLHLVQTHAAVRWRADQRKELEHLCRYITRPAIANERLTRNRAGQVVLQLKSRVTKTAPPISSCRRWNSCSAWPPWCPARAYI